jgi:hypothetical protein
MPSPSTIRPAAPASSSVRGAPSSTIWVISWRRMNDVPKSHVTTPLAKSQYCSRIGRSRPSWRRSSALRSVVCTGFSTKFVGSPGVMRSARNTTTDATNMTTIV